MEAYIHFSLVPYMLFVNNFITDEIVGETSSNVPEVAAGHEGKTAGAAFAGASSCGTSDGEGATASGGGGGGPGEGGGGDRKPPPGDFGGGDDDEEDEEVEEEAEEDDGYYLNGMCLVAHLYSEKQNRKIKLLI